MFAVIQLKMTNRTNNGMCFFFVFDIVLLQMWLEDRFYNFEMISVSHFNERRFYRRIFIENLHTIINFPQSQFPIKTPIKSRLSNLNPISIYK